MVWNAIMLVIDQPVFAKTITESLHSSRLATGICRLNTVLNAMALSLNSCCAGGKLFFEAHSIIVQCCENYRNSPNFDISQ